VCAPVTDALLEGYPSPGGLDDVLGFEIFQADAEACRGRFTVDLRVQQPYGLVHGGAYAALAESMASFATALSVLDRGQIAVGMANNTTFLRPVTEGHVDAQGKPLHRGRTTWVWDVEFKDAAGRVCALSRVTLAVRAAPPG
jgi:1,4-dihydroxy-2-naphthoyl-CoA hydrolase